MYLLKSSTSERTYVGYSCDPHRRLRQHNGELAGGAAPINGRPWQLVLIVRGFATKHAALAFESAWQKPHKNRHVQRVWNTAYGLKKTDVRTKLRALCVLAENAAWAADPLDVHVLRGARVPHEVRKILLQFVRVIDPEAQLRPASKSSNGVSRASASVLKW